MASGSAAKKSPAGLIRLLALLVVAAGVIMLIAGAATWFTVANQLADEKITVSADADNFAGDKIDGPLTAYAEAQVIEKHALAASGGKTYAELAKEDPKREVVMTGSFLRSSLFTSVVSFGVAAMAMGLGVLFLIIGYALFAVGRSLPPVGSPAID
ncbi:aromatic ring-opening dioxygenase LigA [Actinoplanes teichomyceticus]|uniref:Aromatic ring-opening dioxygenase LigA n=1 Tax=Actinoplanes teichomyceticus TaxID=1867 RepID=A0A561VIR7_ACTTI|nr:aromatic ring-opening dioxygenase LigA [Actinoplanes teichomyceticus]TWG11502.1 hypothetical protein FHX34_106232 [Actinoplanes teichomyceticus]GIF15684.1 hypothetical protein Ate01nite_57160 [Actinoplanes teichomyceticus]